MCPGEWNEFTCEEGPMELMGFIDCVGVKTDSVPSERGQ
jgi:hypothetical protein